MVGSEERESDRFSWTIFTLTNELINIEFMWSQTQFSRARPDGLVGDARRAGSKRLRKERSYVDRTQDAGCVFVGRVTWTLIS